MQIYNTISRKKEPFVPIESGKVTIYACGPTVYNQIHIGNARPLVVFDALRRYLAFIGYEVTFVQNFTDIDDKIIKRAHQQQTTASALAKTYIEEYQKDAEGLRLLPPNIQPKVTDSMGIILSFIKRLIEKENAYQAGEDVYFRTKSFSEYGKLSHMPLEELEAGNRVQINPNKEDPLDFVLWKGAKPDEPSWDSPWGKGRPGWHIECSAMATHYLAPTIDIHCGGQDLIFPHHENEIAQSEAAHGIPFAHYWMHNGYINIDNKKMSKSAGNFLTVREVAEKYGYPAIRYLMLQAHYRSPIQYSDDIMKQSILSLQRLENFRKNLPFAMQMAPNRSATHDSLQHLEDMRQAFVDAMEDDFNTADALAILFEMVREWNPILSDLSQTTQENLLALQSTFDQFTGILGLFSEQKETQPPDEVLTLFEKRKEARMKKNYTLADSLREQIAELGYSVEETRQGSKLVQRDNR